MATIYQNETRTGGCRYVTLIDLARDNWGARDDDVHEDVRTRRESRARSEAKRRRCETLTEPLARQWGLLRTVCSVSPCCSHPLDRPSRSLTHLPSSSSSYANIPPPFYYFSQPFVRAFSRSSSSYAPRGAYDPTLRLVVIAYTRNTGKHRQHCAILRPKCRNIARGPSSSLSRTRESHRRDSGSPIQRWGLIDMILHIVVLTPKLRIHNFTPCRSSRDCVG